MRALINIALTASLSMIAGMTDAIGFSQTGEFVSFMSGNTTRMAIAAGSGDWTRAERLATVLALFVVGNVLGAIVARLGGRRHGTVLLTYIVVLLALAAGLPAIPGLSDTLGLEDLPGMRHLPYLNMTLPSLVLMILAMGALNSTVEIVEGVGVGLTYVTGALSKFGRGLGNYIMGSGKLDWTIQAIPWTGLVLGALAGTMLDDTLGRHALWLPCGLTLLLVVCTLLLPEDWQKQFI